MPFQYPYPLFAIQDRANNLGAALTGTVPIDLTLGTYHYGTITGTTTLLITNPQASGIVSSFIMELTNGGAHTVNWPSGTKWPVGVPPTLTAAGVDLLSFISRDGGTTWHAAASELNSS